MKQKVILVIVLFLLIIDLSFIGIVSTSYAYPNKDIEMTSTRSIHETTLMETTIKEEITNISINAMGDCTIGYDDNFGYINSFNQILDNNNYEYFFSNVKKILDKDDISFVNLEGTFTDATEKREKTFNFKAPKDYVNVLTSGSIELVNIANNHTYDYNEIGYSDTLNTLESKVNYFGYDNYYIYQKDNIKLGFSGIYCIEDMNCTKKIDNSIKYFKDKGITTIILSFHWGIEKDYKQSEIQTYLAHYAIDSGVELVLGHHPHVLQGIEKYKDKYIVYSLGNFVFGGNKNPSDKDSMIFNINFIYKKNIIDETIINIYPVSISSVNNINDYKPTLLTGNEYERVINKIQTNSIGVKLS